MGDCYLGKIQSKLQQAAAATNPEYPKSDLSFVHLRIRHRKLHDFLYRCECRNRLHKSVTEFETVTAGK